MISQELRKTSDLHTALSFSDQYRDTWSSANAIHKQAQDIRTQLETIYATTLNRSERDEVSKVRLDEIPESSDDLVQVLQEIKDGPLSQRAKEYRRDQEIGRFWLEHSGEVTGKSGAEYTTIFGPHMQQQATERASNIAELRPELVDSAHDMYEAALENPDRGAFGFKDRSSPETHPTMTREQVNATY